MENLDNVLLYPWNLHCCKAFIAWRPSPPSITILHPPTGPGSLVILPDEENPLCFITYYINALYVPADDNTVVGSSLVICIIYYPQWRNFMVGPQSISGKTTFYTIFTGFTYYFPAIYANGCNAHLPLYTNDLLVNGNWDCS